MKIEFDTATLTTDEARGVIALLDTLYGSAVLPVPVTITPHPETGATTARQYAPERKTGFPVEMGMGYGQDPRAVDGFPMAPEEVNPHEDAVGLEPPRAEGERDVHGTPWDERIHASTRTTNKDGSWTRRRNTPDAVFDAVMAELKGTAPTPEPEETNAAAAFAPAPPAPPAPTAIPTPPAPTPAAAGARFVDLMKLVTEGQASGKLTKEVIDSVVQGAGAAGLGELVKPDAVAARAAIIAQLSALLA